MDGHCSSNCCWWPAWGLQPPVCVPYPARYTGTGRITSSSGSKWSAFLGILATSNWTDLGSFLPRHAPPNLSLLQILTPQSNRVNEVLNYYEYVFGERVWAPTFVGSYSAERTVWTIMLLQRRRPRVGCAMQCRCPVTDALQLGRCSGCSAGPLLIRALGAIPPRMNILASNERRSKKPINLRILRSEMIMSATRSDERPPHNEQHVAAAMVSGRQLTITGARMIKNSIRVSPLFH